MNTLRRKIHIL